MSREARMLRLVAQSKLYADEDYVPKQEFEIGERVKCHLFCGTVVGYLAQVHTDNLFVIQWDGDWSDSDYYAASSLRSAHDADVAA